MLTNTIMALKSFKNFSFDSIKPDSPNRRHRDIIEFFMKDQNDQRQWLFMFSKQFDSLLIKNEFDNYQDLVKLHAKDIKIVSSNISQTKKDEFSRRFGQISDSILDVVYKINQSSINDFKTSKTLSISDSRLTECPVGLFIDGTDIDDGTFEELTSIISKLGTSITDISLKAKSKYQLQYFLKSIRGRRNLDKLTYVTGAEQTSKHTYFKLPCSQ